MKIVILQLLLSAALALPQVPVSCGGTSSCCKMRTAQLQHREHENSHGGCCCDIGDCSSRREPLTMARMLHQSDHASIQASVVLPLFRDTEESLFFCSSLLFQKWGYKGGGLFLARLFCVFRC